MLLVLLLSCTFRLTGQILAGFRASGLSGEQQMVIEDSPPGTRILINAPLKGFEQGRRVLLIFFALPNGNSIEQTSGKNLKPGDDWHYNIQHIAAQTRFLRSKMKERTIVTVYLQAQQKSWSQWIANTPDSLAKLKSIVDDITSMFSAWDPEIELNSHSGGGRFIFSYIDAVENIPGKIKGITFMDSNYGYEDTVSGPKILRWLKAFPDTRLCILAYNDSVVIYNGKQLVSPTGGTWYRSKMMKNYLSEDFDFRVKTRNSIIWNSAQKGRIEILLRNNPEGKIYHTVQVEKNGFIHSTVHGTSLENKGYRYFGKRAYSRFISDTVVMPLRRLNIPRRVPGAESGQAFMARIDTLPLPEREEEIYKAVSSGNIPGFIRNLVTLNGDFADSAGIIHKVTYEVMPDYLAVGSDSDFCRIPMNPYTAQRIATFFGASLVTSKVSDHIYANAEVKLTPFNYVPVGNQNELVSKFEAHNTQIERQMKEAGGKNGQLVDGIKKDVILSSRIAKQPGKVVIYGWHKPGGIPIQPVYSGHVWWYVDYSHGIRLINNQVLIDGKPYLFSSILHDPLLFRVFSNESGSMDETVYIKR
jgi:hypothetical protein